jgi:hypothetical protein
MLVGFRRRQDRRASADWSSQRTTIEVDGNAQTEIDLPVGESETTETVQGSSWLFEPAKKHESHPDSGGV